MLKKRKKFLSNRNRKTKKIPFFRILFYLILAVFLGTVFYTLFFSPMLQILSVKVSGNENISQSLILEEINAEISKKYLGCVNKDNLLLANTRKIKKNILENFKGIKKIEIKRKFPNHLEVNVSERIPTVVFCGRENCLILDENGRAYDGADSFFSRENRDSFLKITDESSGRINLSDELLEPNYIFYTKEMRERLIQDLGLELENNFRTPNIISNDIRVKVKPGWEIYFNREIELEKEIKMLKTALNNSLNSEQKKDNLEYIDLRIDGKVFYKFRNDTPEGLAKEAEIEAEKKAQEKIETEKKDK